MEEGNSTGPPLVCPDYNSTGEQLLDDLSYWIEGVAQTTVALSGIGCNLVASIILSAKDMRNSFNLLLIALAFFDGCYNFGSILESFRKSFKMATTVHIILFPYFLYPFQMIAMTASIFMTVAIAMERFFAVHYPLDYNQVPYRITTIRVMRKFVKTVVCTVAQNGSLYCGPKR